MHIMPILSTLRRHRTAAALIILEIALTCAIVCNAVFVIGERLTRMNRPSGVAEEELVQIRVAGIGKDANPEALTAEDLAALSAVPGVKSVATSTQVPFGTSSWNSDVTLSEDQVIASLSSSTYFGTEDLLETLGVRLIAGRDFTPGEYVDWDDAQKPETKISSIIITRAMGEKLWPDKNALGQTLYMGDDPLRVVGIVDRLARPNEFHGPTQYDYSSFMPIRMPYTAGRYVLRVDPERRDEAVAGAVAALEKNSRSRLIMDKKSLVELRAEYYRQDRSMAWMLVAVCAALLIITALGIIGLASFWVQQRTRQIGIRRAVGASRRQILRYFQTENFLLASVGIFLGMALAYGINLWLMERYALPRLPAGFLPFGAITLWLLGQIAVLGPALRAAAVPPAVATRTV
jgi:putative ABC transport system permease protein